MKQRNLELSKKIGKKIAELRKIHCLSQEELADRCGLHRTYIGSCERGERNITIQNLNNICTSLNVTLADFFSDF